MTIGIAGGKGMIGSHLIRHFKSRWPGPIRAIVRSLSRVEAESLQNIEVLYGDLRSLHDCAAFVRGVDTIFYLAHTNTPITSDLDFPSDAALNLIPLLTLIQAIQTAKTCPHIVYLSSGGAIYGSSASRTPFREEDPCLPASSYGLQKLAAEHYLRLAALKRILTATVLRVSNAYGAFLPNQSLQGLIGVTMNHLSCGKPARVFGALDNIRDYVHLDDIVHACESVTQPRDAFEIYNIGAGVGHTVTEVLQIIAECLQIDFPWEETSIVEGAQWLSPWVVLDISKAKNNLGWVPAIDLRSGVKRLAALARGAAA
jgi:UDP-glucose 4-epimerase